MPSSANPRGPRFRQNRGPQGVGLTRRAVLSGAALLGIGAGVDRAVTSASAQSAAAAAAPDTVPFHGPHQAGIATPQQRHLHFAAFDLTTTSASSLRDLLRLWSQAAATLTTGREYAPTPQTPLRAPTDPGEAAGLAPAQLTLTFGLGPTLFVSGGRDRFGLAHRRPAGLAPLPPFPGEALDPRRSGGDLCVQACADDPQVAFHAIHVLSRLAAGNAVMRWSQTGFRSPPGPADTQQTPRNLIGFKDGTDNIRPGDADAMRQFVWVQDGDQPTWMHGGSYLVARRIEIVLSTWDALPLVQQERVIGRDKATGAPLGGRHEHDPVDLNATDQHGNPVIPGNAHIRVAAPARNGGRRILRRGYAFSEGTTPAAIQAGTGGVDGGLFFIAFTRDPGRQFIPLQRRVAMTDALTAFTVHTASAVFACPPGTAPGGFIGQSLLA